MSRDLRDMVRFLSKSKGMLLGTSDLLGLPQGQDPWTHLRGKKWGEEMGVEMLVGEIERMLLLLRSSLTWLAHAALSEPENDTLVKGCEDLTFKISKMLKDYGNNRRLKR